MDLNRKLREEKIKMCNKHMNTYKLNGSEKPFLTPQIGKHNFVNDTAVWEKIQRNRHLLLG